MVSPKCLSIIVAVDQQNGIGKNGTLPWYIKEDLIHFKKITVTTTNPTKTNVVIMGRKTWESLPAQSRPLPNRLNVILTSNTNYPIPNNVIRASNLPDALNQLKNKPIEQIFIIGGATIYQEALIFPQTQTIYITRIHQTYDCDTFINEPLNLGYQKINQTKTHSENNLTYHFEVLSKQ